MNLSCSHFYMFFFLTVVGVNSCSSKLAVKVATNQNSGSEIKSPTDQSSSELTNNSKPTWSWTSSESDLEFTTTSDDVVPDKSVVGSTATSFTTPAALADGEQTLVVWARKNSKLPWKKYTKLTKIIDTIAPKISKITSSNANGTYIKDDVIKIKVEFSEAISVSGTPELLIGISPTARAASYSAVSGQVMEFDFVVGANDSASDLDVESTGALTIAGTILDAAGNAAELVLPKGNTVPNSLAALSDIVVAVRPYVTSVSSSTANGAFKQGGSIQIEVVFSSIVNVTGTPVLTLETGTTDTTINYLSGSGGATLVFSYTVGAGHNSSDLDYAATTSLALNGGTIKDAAGNDATLTLPTVGGVNSIAGQKAIVVDINAADCRRC